MSKCCVLGLGYIGLPTSVILAKAGHEVIGCDINKNLVETINEGKKTISEKNLNEYLGQVLRERRFKAQTNVDNADIFIIVIRKLSSKINSIMTKTMAKRHGKQLKQLAMIIITTYKL